MGALLIEWVPILPFEERVWADNAVEGIESLGHSWDLRFRQPQDATANILILAYMAADHASIQDSRLLDKKLVQVGATAGVRVIIIACGMSAPEIDWNDVKTLAVDQSFHHGVSLEVARSANTVVFTESLVTLITQALRLTGAVSLSKNASADALPLPTESQSFTPRRIDEI